MWIDKGLNDRWPRPRALKRVGARAYAIALREPLGRDWPGEIVTYELPADLRRARVRVTLEGRETPSQRSGGAVAILVENLRAGEEREYLLTAIAGRGGKRAADADPFFTFAKSGASVVFSNGVVSLKLPTRAAEGPIAAVRHGDGPWMGRGRMEVPCPAVSVRTRLVEQGPLWATAEVLYAFAGGYRYRMRLTLRSGDAACEVTEASTLPVRLWPAPRPYKEIGTQGKSYWDQNRADIARPCTRPCPTSHFVFEVDANRMVTHSTGSWELMDLALRSPALKTYTAMRPALPYIDGAWMGVYHTRQADLLGVVSVDIAHWATPDDTVHPAHRTPGAGAEVLLVDSRAGGTQFRFPVENVARRWLLAVGPRPAKPLGPAPDPNFPLWALHIRRGALRLDKIKDWVVDWPDAGAAHPRVLCSRREFGDIRRKVKATPEFRRNRAKYKRWRGADEYLLSGRVCRLAEIEAQTHARELVEKILGSGYAGPPYCIMFARPLRRYTLACDMVWDGFTAEEKREARRVCALAAYFLSDGDFWQFAYRPGETTYLPNFNTDEHTCVGLLGLFLSDHPCSRAWVNHCVERLDTELPMYLRRDGGGEENLGGYLFSTWTQLYLPIFWALRRNRVKDYARDPNVLAGARFLVKVCGPPDRRSRGERLGFPIGHHPHAKKAYPVYSQLASFIRKADPRTAARLMWMWRQCGAPVGNWHDHFGPSGNPLTRHYIFHDPTIPETAPRLASYNLPHVGAVIRSHDASGRGSCLFLKAGRVHSHHDPDEGSFHYFGRGAPLALDGLPIQNGATREEHNQVSFGKPGQPSGVVECFRTGPAGDYIRAVIAPRAFSCDSMYVDGSHRSGWTREIVMVKAPRPGGVEYLVVKDTCTGPDPAQWNLDVLTRKPRRVAPNRVWFPGHPQCGMGMDLIVAEPAAPRLNLVKGWVGKDMMTARGRRALPDNRVKWDVLEHWLAHMRAGPGATFAAVLFPRRADEPTPAVEYLGREETFRIRHADGCDLVWLRPNPAVGTSLDGVAIRGRAGLARERAGRRVIRHW